MRIAEIRAGLSYLRSSNESFGQSPSAVILACETTPVSVLNRSLKQVSNGRFKIVAMDLTN
jgi:hypothetical protein